MPQVKGAPQAQAPPRRVPLPEDLLTVNVRSAFEAVVQCDPDRPFLLTRSERFTYAEFNARVDRCSAMWAAMGVRKGDRVLFALQNCREFVEAWLGLAKIGAVLAAVNPQLSVQELRPLIELVEPRAALAGPGAPAAALGAVVPAEILLTLGDDPGVPTYASMVEQTYPPAPRPELVADDLLSLIFTSGTTGSSKAVMQTHGNYVLTGEAYRTWLGLEAGDTIYCSMPLFHVNAQAYSTMGAIALGGTLALAERFSASRFWEDVNLFKATAFNFVGAMLAILAKADPSPLETTHQARIAYGAPTLPDELLRHFERRVGIRFLTGWGMSETTFGLIESLDLERRPGTLGKPRQHPDSRLVNEGRIVDDNGCDCPAGVVGEMVFRSPMMMVGYFNEPDRTAEAIRDGWLHTGDLGWVDDDGYFYFADRRKAIIRRRGENISSSEVELVLRTYSGVLDCAVIPVPAELAEEEALALLVPADGGGIDPAAVIAHCRRSLAAFKVPRYYQIVPDLPKTATERVEKQKLQPLIDSRRWFDADKVSKD